MCLCEESLDGVKMALKVLRECFTCIQLVAWDPVLNPYNAMDWASGSMGAWRPNRAKMQASDLWQHVVAFITEHLGMFTELGRTCWAWHIELNPSDCEALQQGSSVCWRRRHVKQRKDQQCAGTWYPDILNVESGWIGSTGLDRLNLAGGWIRLCEESRTDASDWSDSGGELARCPSMPWPSDLVFMQCLTTVTKKIARVTSSKLCRLCHLCQSVKAVYFTIFWYILH